MDAAIEQLMQEASRFIEHGVVARGLGQFKSLTRDYPANSQVFLHYALSLDQLSKESEAIPNYQKALELGLSSDDERTALISLASSYRNVGNLDAALETINQALEKNKDHPAVLCFYSLILLDSNQPAQAVKTLGGLLLNEVDPEKFAGFDQALSAKFKELIED